MAPPVGFVLLTHSNPAQILRLTNRLIQLYDNPPIACHHDFDKCSLEGWNFSKDIFFVSPHIKTGWGKISCVSAFLAGLRTLYERSDSPDRFVFLSGADYPVRSPDLVRAELSAGGFDAHIDHRLVVHDYKPGPTDNEPHGFRSPGWVPTAYDRYIAIKLWVPYYSFRKGKLAKFRFCTIRSPWLLKPFTPFAGAFQCYGGEWWFSGSRKAAERFLVDDPVTERMFRHFKNRMAPDEAFAQTLLCNQPDLRLSEENNRYVDWTAGGHHPRILSVDDIPRIMESGKHFARKFDLSLGAEVFDRIDAMVDRQLRG
jgi:hypothetical protein